MKTDNLMKKVTDRIAENLSSDNWKKPWGKLATGDAPHNAITGRPYSGVNVLILSLNDYSSNSWLTFKQAKELGGSVKRYENGEQIVYWKKVKKKVDKPSFDDNGNEIPSSYMLMRTYTVFNIEQCENLDTNKLKKFEPLKVNAGSAVELADDMGANVNFGGNQACFIPSVDVIKVPHLSAFDNQENFEATLLHELTHWTGHSDRLNRTKGKAFGDRDYAFEELIAELGAAMAGALLGLPYEGLQHEKYIASWLKSFDGDAKYLYDAAKYAQKAVDYMVENLSLIHI